jgi:hypothetical protein
MVNRFCLEMKLEIHGREGKTAWATLLARRRVLAAEQCPLGGGLRASIPPCAAVIAVNELNLRSLPPCYKTDKIDPAGYGKFRNWEGMKDEGRIEERTR